LPHWVASVQQPAPPQVPWEVLPVLLEVPLGPQRVALEVPLVVVEQEPVGVLGRPRVQLVEQVQDLVEQPQPPELWGPLVLQEVSVVVSRVPSSVLVEVRFLVASWAPLRQLRGF